MKCTKCGHINKQDSLFCENCGTRLNEEKPVGKQSSNAWKWVAIVSIILFVITLSVNIGDSPSSSSNEQRLRDRISQLERKNSGLRDDLYVAQRQVGQLKGELLDCNSNSKSCNDTYYKQQIESLNKQIKNLQNSTNQSNNNVSSTELRNLRNELKNLKEKNSALETQLSNQVQELIQLRTERDALKVKLFSNKR